jgi:hypothetical protein
MDDPELPEGAGNANRNFHRLPTSVDYHRLTDYKNNHHDRLLPDVSHVVLLLSQHVALWRK